jgi:hypothetical protein
MSSLFVNDNRLSGEVLLYAKKRTSFWKQLLLRSLNQATYKDLFLNKTNDEKSLESIRKDLFGNLTDAQWSELCNHKNQPVKTCYLTAAPSIRLVLQKYSVFKEQDWKKFYSYLENTWWDPDLQPLKMVEIETNHLHEPDSKSLLLSNVHSQRSYSSLRSKNKSKSLQYFANGNVNTRITRSKMYVSLFHSNDFKLSAWKNFCYYWKLSQYEDTLWDPVSISIHKQQVNSFSTREREREREIELEGLDEIVLDSSSSSSTTSGTTTTSSNPVSSTRIITPTSSVIETRKRNSSSTTNTNGSKRTRSSSSNNSALLSTLNNEFSQAPTVINMET